MDGKREHSNSEGGDIAEEGKTSTVRLYIVEVGQRYCREMRHCGLCSCAEYSKVERREIRTKLTGSHQVRVDLQKGHLSNLLSNSATLAFDSSFSCKVVASSASRLSTI
jgi:hypothetical protein